MTEKCCGNLEKVSTEKAKDTVWTTYRCTKCKRMQTTVEKKVPQFDYQDIDGIWGI